MIQVVEVKILKCYMNDVEETFVISSDKPPTSFTPLKEGNFIVGTSKP